MGIEKASCCFAIPIIILDNENVNYICSLGEHCEMQRNQLMKTIREGCMSPVPMKLGSGASINGGADLDATVEIVGEFPKGGQK